MDRQERRHARRRIRVCGSGRKESDSGAHRLSHAPVILADCAKKISCLPPAVISIEELAEVIRETAKNKKKKASGFRAGDMTKKNSKNTEPLIDGTWIKEQKISLWNCFDPALT